MPRKRKFTPIEEVIARLKAEMGPQTPEEEFEHAFSVRAHVNRTGLAIALVKGRKAKNLTQAQLAKITGIPQGEISRMEGSLANPTLETMSKLGAALDFRVTFSPADPL